MLNVTFAGNIFDSIETQYPNNEVAYQALHIHNDIPTWNDVHLSEHGQYNINLGDGDWLTQDGSQSINDKIIICFWTNNTSIRNDLNLTEWSYIEIDLNGSNTYLNDVQTMPHQNPQCNFTTFDNVILDNVGTTNDQFWMFHGIEHFQRYERLENIIFPIMSFEPNSTEINWGDGTIETVPLDSDYHHEYTLAGDYHIIVKVTNRGNLYCQSEFDVQASFTITPGLTWPIPVFRTFPVTFTPNITGDIEQITSVSYSINGVETYTDLQYDETFTHTFDSPGPFIITQSIIYDNIFEVSTINTNYTVYIDSVANFYKDAGTCGPDFIDNSIIGNGSITEHYWAVKFNDEIIAEYTGDSSWEYTWPYIGVFTVIHKIKDSEGNQFGIERIYDVTECPGQIVEGDNGGGGGGGWTQTVYVEREFPKLSVEKLVDVNEHINIDIRLTLL